MSQREREILFHHIFPRSDSKSYSIYELYLMMQAKKSLSPQSVQSVFFSSVSLSLRHSVFAPVLLFLYPSSTVFISNMTARMTI